MQREAEDWNYGRHRRIENSGRSALPPEIAARWNWGAFLLSWIWGIGNQVWQAMYTFIPFVGFAYMFVLGARGNEFAWNARSWSSVEEFKRVQRNWAIAGVIFTVAWMGLAALLINAHRIETARTIGKNPVCIDANSMQDGEVPCSSDRATDQILKVVKTESECDLVPHSNVKSTEVGDPAGPKVTCMRHIPGADYGF